MRALWMILPVMALACGTPEDDKSTDTDVTDTDVTDTDVELTRIEEIQALTGVPADGETVYTSATTGNCASCHATDGTGGIGSDLTDKVPGLDEEAAIEIVLNGEGLMGAYDGFLTDQQIADVVAYIYDEFGG